MYTADSKRYETMQYNRCGASGLKLPIVSLGLWHNFGEHEGNVPHRIRPRHYPLRSR